MGPCLTLYFDLNITHHNSKKILCHKSGQLHVRPVLGSGACSCWWSGSCRAVLFHMVPGFCRLMGWTSPRHEVVQFPAVCCKWHPGIMMIFAYYLVSRKPKHVTNSASKEIGNKCHIQLTAQALTSIRDAGKHCWEQLAFGCGRVPATRDTQVGRNIDGNSMVSWLGVGAYP